MFVGMITDSAENVLACINRQMLIVEPVTDLAEPAILAYRQNLVPCITKCLSLTVNMA